MPDAATLPPKDAYPNTIEEFYQRFPTEAACRGYLMKLRWPDGFQCPACKAFCTPWIKSTGLLHCPFCDLQTSVIAGTIFQDTKKPLRLWFLAAWHITNQKTGVSALGVQRALGLKKYETAWTWLHKFRRAMVRPGREKLSGTIQIDETWVGAATPRVSGRATRRAIVVIAVEELGRKLGRVRLRYVPDLRAETVQPFIDECCEVGSIVHTDGSSTYRLVTGMGFKHTVTRINRIDPEDMENALPHVHRVASLLKRWLLGTHQGAPRRRYLEYYLDEFTFRFNRRASSSRGLLFYRLLQQSVALEPQPYHDLQRSKSGTIRQESVG